MTFLKIPDDQPIEHAMVSKSIQQAQVKVEGFNFDTRKHVVEYDDVANKQREIIYKLRRRVLAGSAESEGESLKSEILGKLQSEVDNLFSMYSPDGISAEELDALTKEFSEIIPFDDNSLKAIRQQLSPLSLEDKKSLLTKIISDTYSSREKQVGEPVMREIEKYAYLSAIDKLWMDHLDALDDLREGIGLRGYGQREPLVEYKNEAFQMFERLMAQINYELTRRIFRIQVAGAAPPSAATAAQELLAQAEENVDTTDLTGLSTSTSVATDKVQPPPGQRPSGPEATTKSGFLGALKSLGRAKSGNGTQSMTDLTAAMQSLGGTALTKAAERASQGRIYKTPIQNPYKDVGRNDPCPCGAINPATGQPYKYKKCGLINAPYHKS